MTTTIVKLLFSAGVITAGVTIPTVMADDLKLQANNIADSYRCVVEHEGQILQPEWDCQFNEVKLYDYDKAQEMAEMWDRYIEAQKEVKYEQTQI